MSKYLLMLFTLLTLNVCAKSTEKTNLARLEGIQQQQSITIDNTAFVFDLHDVLFNLDSAQARTAFFNSNHKWNIVKNLIKYGFNKVFSQHNEDPYLSIEYAFKNKKSFGDALKLLNAHVPIEETFELVKALKEKGYHVYICSNIGERSLDYLKTKYPTHFALFNGCRVCTAANKYVTKKSPKAFAECKQMILADKSTINNILIIDDSAAKIKVAESVEGFVGIQFTSSSALKTLLSTFITV